MQQIPTAVLQAAVGLLDSAIKYKAHAVLALLLNMIPSLRTNAEQALPAVQKRLQGGFASGLHQALQDMGDPPLDCHALEKACNKQLALIDAELQEVGQGGQQDVSQAGLSGWRDGVWRLLCSWFQLQHSA